MFEGTQHSDKVIGETNRAGISFFHTQLLSISVLSG
jgi:hypothetical protein